MLQLVIFILDIIVTVVLAISTNLYTYSWGGWLILAIFIANYVAFVGLFWLECVIESLFIKYDKRPSERARKYFHFKALLIANALLFFSNVKVKKVNIPESITKDHLIVFNHSSGYDPLIIMDTMRGTSKCFIVKKELFSNTNPIGKIMFAAGAYGINRDDPFEGARIIKAASKEISENHRSVIVAPEGTRSHKQELGEMHPGTFKIAFNAKCDIAVIGIKNAYKIRKHIFFKHTDVEIELLAVLDYEKFKESTTLDIKNEVENIYKDYLNR